jgi:peptidoglycan/xylan/chitin deacetylase (PgdA/CDA1 family)
LDKSVHLPSYIGSVRVALSREELGSAFLLPITQLAMPTPTPKPTAAPSKAPSQLDTSKPMIALTFDDGPSVYTTRILNLLTKYNSRATFFEVGNRMAGKADVMKAIVAAGSEIAGHSWDHRQLTKLSVNEIRDEMTSTAATIKKYTGVNASLVRPPYGAYNDTVRKVAKELGIVLINWSVDTLDWKSRNADAVYDATMKHAKRGAIVLYHDLYESTAAAMERVIPKLVDDGYQLITVSELMGKMNPGQVYNGKQ